MAPYLGLAGGGRKKWKDARFGRENSSWGVTPAIQSGLAGNHGLASLYGPDGRKDTLQRFFHQQPSSITFVILR